MDAEGLVGRTLVGRFRIDRILGRGGMATVYAAYDEERAIPVALKVLKPELSRDEMVLKRFAREAKAASHLQHPNVVEVLDWGVDAQEAFISMELAQGTDLLKALAKQRPMKQIRAVLVLQQVCAALSAAHSRGIVHRDLKPENILLVPDPSEPGGERAKVLDFGIAKILDVSKTGSSNPDEPPSYVTKTALTRVGTIVGTPAYMSPEQCRGGEIDGRSDVYACGVLLYQLVTGELPFTGETPLHTAMRHIHAQPRAPSELRRDLAPALERVISKALAKWPGERQQSADQLRDELLATIPTLPDRTEIALPQGFGPRPTAAPAPARNQSKPPQPAHAPTAPAAPPAPPPPVAAPPPARVSSDQPTDSGLGPPAQKLPAPGVEDRREAEPQSEIDGTNPTRQLVGGPLGATPLRAVRLIRGVADSGPTSRPSESNAPPASLPPSTTEPEGSLTEVDPPPAADDDDDPRTLSVAKSAVDQIEEGIITQDPVATPRTAPAASATADNKPDPLDTARTARGQAPTLQAPPGLSAQPGALAQPPRKILPRTEQLSQPQPPGPTGPGEIVRTRAGTERPPLRSSPPPKPKSTQTGLTPTMQKPQGGQQAGAGPAAAHLAGTPQGQTSSSVTAPIAHSQPPARPAQPAPPRMANPTAPLQLPPPPQGSFVPRAQLQQHPPAAPPAAGALRAPSPPGHALASPQPAPIPSAIPQAPGVQQDDDEPRTNVREVGGPPSNSGKTLVMEETASQGAAPSVTQNRMISPPQQKALSQPGPGPAPSPLAQQASMSSMNASYNDPSGLYTSQDTDAFRGLKATARIEESVSSERVTNPINFAQTGENLQGVKATVRMNPQDTMNAVANHVGGSQSGHGPSATPIRPLAPPPAAGVPAQRVPDLSFQQTGHRLAPASWNEPTVVKRKASGPEQNEGLVSSLQGLSGTTGLLIGIGLGLGIAAGLLIAFLLARG